MLGILELDAAGLRPEPEFLLRSQGLPPGREPEPEIAALAEEALDLLERHLRPAALAEEVDREAFAAIYRGRGLNAERTPLEEIFPRADRLALFALTLGAELGEAVSRGFAEGDFALATLLDAAASEAAERAAEVLQLRVGESWEPGLALMRYSPGYCGWHLSGQEALFARLRPGRAGITLRESGLMEPLKSISGVIVGGEASIHDFDDCFEFCAGCAERACRERIRSLGGRH